jgi:segregation and condensation protein B
METSLEQKIEAILFWKAEPMTFKSIASLLKADESSVQSALTTLEAQLANRGLTLVRNDSEVMLGTSKALSPLIEALAKEEISKELGKAGLETISLILYLGPISRADIDYIRGVNSQFIVRNLLIRGLVDRVENPKDARSFLYKPSLQLLSHLGLSKPEDAPEYAQVRAEIETFKADTNVTD